jgi:predicted DNA binding CopG/RHH family protein
MISKIDLLILDAAKKDKNFPLRLPEALHKDATQAASKSNQKLVQFIRMSIIEKISSEHPYEFLPEVFLYEGLPKGSPLSLQISKDLLEAITMDLKKADLVFQEYVRLSLAEKILKTK